jgi:hypothetical protein
MTHISRPFQIALVAVAVFAAAWFFPRSHGATGVPPSQPASAPKSVASSSSGTESSPAAATPVYHGSAPGVAGLSRAIAKAHEAVAASERSAKQLEERSVHTGASSSTAGVSGSSSTGSSATGSKLTLPSKPVVSPQVKQRVKPETASQTRPHTSTTHTASTTHTTTPNHTTPNHTTTKHTTTTTHITTTVSPPVVRKAVSSATGTSVTPAGVPAKQALVEKELKQGAVVALLFWNPKAAVDVAVHRELQLLQAVHKDIQSVRNVPVVRAMLKALDLELGSKIAVQEALASQVAEFGSITRAVQVYQTPTILLINGKGQTTALTGLTDAFAIEQALDETRHA